MTAVMTQNHRNAIPLEARIRRDVWLLYRIATLNDEERQLIERVMAHAPKLTFWDAVDCLDAAGM
jgi:hypothetical protein